MRFRLSCQVPCVCMGLFLFAGLVGVYSGVFSGLPRIFKRYSNHLDDWSRRHSLRHFQVASLSQDPFDKNGPMADIRPMRIIADIVLYCRGLRQPG
jgi:hypothetical protein